MGDPVPTDRWQRVKNLFAEVLEAAPAERQEILAEAAREDPLLASEAVALLRAHEDGGPFLEQMVASESQQILAEESGEAFVGRRVGPYEVLRSLGRGGMGLVFLARRADREYQHDVAIKLIRGALPTEEILRRFRAERQTLANLAHPNIARLLDGGRTEDGLPYLVLEYVEGEPIDAFCESRGLSVEARLRLFRVVCEAVQHAHRHLVVHRDLKPGNILVTPEGQVKLLDFGIAKLLPGASHEETSVLTRTTDRAMTPDYASPEQIRGEAVTTASDVYSLGVLLYRILTGQHPYRLDNTRASEVERIICDQEPTKPSSIVPRGSSEKLRRRLRGDLDNIVLKALRKEPRRRYSSVDQFSEDLVRHLEGLPVTARQDTVAYRTGKFLRRHRLAVTAGALVILALLGGLATTTWQSRVASLHARRAEQERALADSRLEDVHRLATAFLFDFHDAIADLPGSTEARELVVARAVEYLDRLARESRQDDPRLQRELAVAYQKIGNVQGNPNNANLGDTASALASYRKALAIAEPLAAAHPMDDEIQRSLAVIYEKLADVAAFRGDVTSARAVSGKSLAIFQRLAGRAPTAVRPQRSFAISRVKAGDLAGHPSFPNAGRKEEALEHYLRSATILERLHAADPSDGATTRYLGLAYERVGTMRLELGNPREALASYRRSLEVRERLARENTAQVEPRRDVGIAYEKIGDASRVLGDRRTAMENYRRSLATFEALAAADPRNANARRTLASGLERMAEALGEFGREEEAWGLYGRALSLRESVAGDSSNVQAQQDLAGTLREAARFAARWGRSDMARAMESRAEEIERSLTAAARAS